ncbi:MAG: diguanylate cyclase [Woeseiaceae bacterium]|nr:diguanylate cyclase [Woeseiaceae bacterium]
MNFEDFLVVGLLLSAAGYLLLGFRVLSSGHQEGKMPIGMLGIIVGVWVAGGAVELISTTTTQFFIGRTAHFIGTAFAPIAAFAAFREYTGRETPTRLVVMLLLIPVVSITLAATNQFHELMWSLPATNADGQFLTRPIEWGPWFLKVHAPYSYIIVGIALLKLLTHTSAIAPVHRRGLVLFLVAFTIPMAATIAYDFGLGPNTISYVPMVFALMLPVFAWLIIGAKVIEFSPLAYETVFQNMQDPVVVVDDNRCIIGLNNRALALLEMSEEDALLRPLEDVFGHGSTCVFEAIESGRPQKMLTDSGRFLHVQASSLASTGSIGRRGKVLMFRDVSDVERAQTEVRKSERLLRTLIDHSVNGILRLRWVHDDETNQKLLRCIFANAAAGRFLNIAPDGLVDREAEFMVKRSSTAMDVDTAEEVLEKFRAAVDAGTGIDVEVQHDDEGSVRWLRLICEPVGDDFAATLVDVTDGKVRERHMESIAWSDPLTGVLNRRGFERDASRRLSASDDKATGALLFIDLNGFKQINDRFGHEVGDQLLKTAAERLRASLRTCDIIGRPGGDEFVALVPDVAAKIAEGLASRLARALEEPYVIGNESLNCAASIGMALYPANANTLTGLLREADQAMYRAKARARDVPNLRATGLLEKAM